MHPFVRHSILFRYGLDYIFIYNFGTFLRYLTDIFYIMRYLRTVLLEHLVTTCL